GASRAGLGVTTMRTFRVRAVRAASAGMIISSVRRKRPAGEPPVRLQISCPRRFHDRWGKGRSGRLLVPARLLQVVANDLLVVALRRSRRGVGGRVPEPRGIRRDRLV